MQLVLTIAALTALTAPAQRETGGAPAEVSIEAKTRVHRLTSTRRSPFDAFVYVNRVPSEPEEDESPEDYAGRVFGRLANQEGRILLKVPPGMNHESYQGLKTFLRYEGRERVGNCAACHTPSRFTDLRQHVVQADGPPRPTPSLRNLSTREVDVRRALLAKIAASALKRSGRGEEIAPAYGTMKLSSQDIPSLVAFLKLLEDVSDKEFRNLILEAGVLDTSEE